MFSPQKVSEHAEAVKAFKNSEAFKKFFDKFDGSATFSDTSLFNDWHKLNLSLTYKKAGEKESGIKKVFGAIKNIFSPNKNEINITEYQYDATLKGEFIRLVMASALADEEKQQVIMSGIKALSGEELD